jgi:DNA-binding response OmpR family regulator
MPKVLVIEDDPAVYQALVDWLESRDYTVEIANTGTEGASRLQVYDYDVAVVDWELPGVSGPEICRQHRLKGGTTPLIMLTGRSELEDKISGLDAGADDYLTKPFHPRELEARIRSVLRRPQAVAQVLSIADITVDPATRTVERAGEVLKLNRREYSLLEFLIRHKGQVFTRDALLNKVWSSESDATDQALRQAIRRLRQAIDVEGRDSLIVSVPGVGYKLQG